MGPTLVARPAVTAILLVCLSGGLFGACGGSDDSDTSGKLVTTHVGALQRTKIDPTTGLQFEVYSSPEKFGGGSTITVRATEETPDATLAELTRLSKVAISCHVPGARTQYFPQPWNRAEGRVSSALLVSGGRPAARHASSCSLALGEPGPEPDTISFSNDLDEAFSSVTFAPPPD
jgi:hypothetical protein